MKRRQENALSCLPASPLDFALAAMPRAVSRAVLFQREPARRPLQKVRVSTTAAREGKSPRASEAAPGRGIGCVPMHQNFCQSNIDTKSCCEKRFEKNKTLQKSQTFSDCRKSILKQIRPSCRKIFRLPFVFVWFRESNEIFRDSSEFSDCVKSFRQLKIKIRNCRARKGLSTSLALQFSNL